jgi:predicted ATPase/pimeloyl-ACP methyl ester carboxylesterase/DNA-binding SARP family transcriptional activator
VNQKTSPMPPLAGQLEIRVLGDLMVARDGVALSLPPSKKTRALLVYLACIGRPQRRERLCELFWDIPDDPRGALRWSLSKIRQILGPDGDCLQADRNVVNLRSDSLFLDCAAVRSLTQQDLATASIEDLEQLAGLFRGRFIDDLSLSRCPEFEAWRIATAEEMELAQVRILRSVIDRLADDPSRALTHAHALQALLPEDEDLEQSVKRLASAARYGATAVTASPGVQPAAPPPPLPTRSPGVETTQAGSLMPTSPDEVRYCTTREGVRLAYAVHGTGPPIIKAANWMSHLRFDRESPIWRHWVAGLSARNCLVRYDERANGLSDWEVSDISFEAMVSDLESIADASGLRRFCLLGISQGCAISIAYAVRHPERVSRLVLYGGYAKGWRRRSDPVDMTRREALAALMRQGWGQQDPSFRQIFTQLFVPAASQEAMDSFNELQRLSVSPENAVRLQDQFSQIDVSGLLALVRVPTLVMHGVHDAVVPFAEGKALADGIPGARFVPLETGNHIMLANEPAFETFLSELRAFASADQSPPVDKPPRLELDGDRRHVTVLALEIVSPLQAFELDDPEIFADHLDPLFDQVAATVERHYGTILSRSDGSLTAVFGATRATEDHAYLACRAALAAKSVVDAQSQGTARLRAGIDTGEALLRRRLDDQRSTLEVVGAPPRTAAQLMRTLRRAVIAATGRARQAAGGYVSMERILPDDLTQAIRNDHAYELLSENSALSRWHLRANQGLTTLVGRQLELDLLRQAWQRVREGTGHVIAIVGEPGVGKSRLTHEFLALPEVAGFTVLECGGMELDASVSYHVIKKLLRAVCGIADPESPSGALERLEKKVAEHGLDARLIPPLAFVLDLQIGDAEWLALDGSERRRRVRAAVRSLLSSESRRKPIALLVEDLHWADTESVSVVRKIAETISAHRILLIVTYRPEYTRSGLGDSHLQVVNLQPLGHSEASALLDSILGAHDSLNDLKSLLIERSEGTPLFLEEWVRSLVETGQLVRGEGDYRVAGSVDIHLPASVQSVIAARIGRLSEEDRSVLQIAAVIGANVPQPLLAALVPHTPETLEDVLARLTRSDFLFELQSFPIVEHSFKHALTQQVAYDSLTTSGRRKLHRHTLLAMERLYAGSLNDLAEKLADHAFRAEEWSAAVTYLVQAADKAVDLSAYNKAARWLEQAVHAVDSLPESPERDRRAVDVRTRMRPVYDAIGSFAKAATRLQEAKDLARKLGDLERHWQVLIHQSYLYSSHGRIDEALAAADELRDLARANGADRYASEADLAAAQALLMRADATSALRHLEPHFERFTGDWRHDRFGLLGTRAVWYLGHYAFAQALLGDFKAADGAAAQAAQIAEEVGRPFDILAARYCGALVEIVRGPTAAFVASFKAVVGDRHTEAAASFRPWLSAVLGHAEYAIGDRTAACETLRQAAAEAKTFDLPQFEAYAQALLACACAGSPKQHSNAELETALALARHNRDHWIEVTVLRAMAERASGEQRIALLNQACETAEQAKFRPEMARARFALGLARGERDRRAAARDLEIAAQLFAAIGLEDACRCVADALSALATAGSAHARGQVTT